MVSDRYGLFLVSSLYNISFGQALSYDIYFVSFVHPTVEAPHVEVTLSLGILSHRYSA